MRGQRSIIKLEMGVIIRNTRGKGGRGAKVQRYGWTTGKKHWKKPDRKGGALKNITGLTHIVLEKVSVDGWKDRTVFRES